MAQAEMEPVPKASVWLVCGEQIGERPMCEEQVRRPLWSYPPADRCVQQVMAQRVADCGRKKESKLGQII